jgi:hypothetical protein
VHFSSDVKDFREAREGIDRGETARAATGQQFVGVRVRR